MNLPKSTIGFLLYTHRWGGNKRMKYIKFLTRLFLLIFGFVLFISGFSIFADNIIIMIPTILISVFCMAEGLEIFVEYKIKNIKSN